MSDKLTIEDLVQYIDTLLVLDVPRYDKYILGQIKQGIQSISDDTVEHTEHDWVVKTRPHIEYPYTWYTTGPRFCADCKIVAYQVEVK